MRLEKAKSRDISLPKSTVGYISKKQVCPGKLENGKRGGRPRSTSLVDRGAQVWWMSRNSFAW